MLGIRRCEFMPLLGGAAAWPLAARAQQGDRVRRIGVLMAGDENDPVRKTSVSAFIQALAGLGWTDGRNVFRPPYPRPSIFFEILCVGLSVMSILTHRV